MKTKLKIFALGLLSFTAVFFNSCKKDKTEETTDTTKKYVLVIENGAQTMSPDGHITYTAVLVDVNGAVSPATGITWTSSSTTIATINTAGVVTAVSTGEVKITGSVTKDNVTYSASVPLGISIPSAFAVAPSAIVWNKGDNLQLESVYMSTTGVTNPTCTYESSNTAIATVSSTGLVTFVEVGECHITVTATSIQGNPVVTVPVLVIGIPEVAIPIIRIEVNPPSKDLFKNETQQLAAKAFKGDGTEATGISFTWNSTDPAIASVSSTGLVTPLKTGTTYIQAKADGIIGQAEITVNSDTLVVVTPFYTSIPAGGTKQFTVQAYHITRTSSAPYTGITFDWQIPTYGFPMFDIATVNATGLVTLKSNAFAGMSTFVMAYDHNNPWVGSVGTIMVGIADDCDCGSGNSSVNSIQVANGSTINMTMISGVPVQLNVTALDAVGGTVASPNLVYCSDNILVASVDANGQIIAAGEGDAVIKICSGTYAETTVNVHVTLMK
ncbi:MAG: Ig-like domain-containing protein [Bacteroidia bacterium]|nr:Ig-like domain-containing protein [Bacteroidia bacterium]